MNETQEKLLRAASKPKLLSMQFYCPKTGNVVTVEVKDVSHVFIEGCPSCGDGQHIEIEFPCPACNQKHETVL